MATTLMLRVDADRLVQAIQEAREKVENGGGEIVLDFSAVTRLDPGAVTAMKALAGTAEAKTAKVCLRGVSVDVYKVLKLVKLADRFSFVN